MSSQDIVVGKMVPQVAESYHTKKSKIHSLETKQNLLLIMVQNLYYIIYNNKPTSQRPVL